jgi:glycosyltransferase involved in cell wall biosynthesis
MLQPQAMRLGKWRKSAAYWLLERTNLSGAARLHASSEQEASALGDLALDVPIGVVPNAVDLEAAASAPRGFRARLGIPPDAFVVLALGRMHRIKRLELLAEAFAQLRETDPSAHLILAGPDEERLGPALMRQLAPHAAFVHVTGPVQGGDKWALVRDADVMVQCSDSESFGLAVAESLAAGVPVVATRTLPWSVLEARECGLWVEQDAGAIAAALRDLARDPDRRAAMGARGETFARETFGWSAVASAMRDLYEQALEGRR